MMPKKVIRIICIIMAALMILSVGAVVLQVIAADEGAVLSYVSPETGDSGSDYYVPAGIAVAAILAVILCLFLPKMKKSTGTADPNKKSSANKSKSDNSKPVKKVQKKP